MPESQAILMTGVTGFIGGALAPALEATHDVIRLVRRPPTDGVNAASNVVCHDLLQPLESARLPGRLGAIVHLAQASGEDSTDPETLFAVNTLSTLQLLEYGRSVGIERFILASSGSVYGHQPGFMHEETPLVPSDLYAASKVAAEQILGLYSNHFLTVAVRIFRPYGPGQRQRLVPTLVRRIVRGEPVTLVNGGQPACQPLYIDDLVVTFQRFLKSDQSLVVNVAGPEVTDIRGVAELIGDILGREPVFNLKDDPTVRSTLADTTKLRTIIGFVPQVGLAHGLRQAVKWLQANEQIQPAAD